VSDYTVEMPMQEVAMIEYYKNHIEDTDDDIGDTALVGGDTEHNFS
jgi:hypothetical protein